ncbi:MAG: DUF2452 domain-containing protein [Gammaproteobacteria bacterium]
MSEHDRTKPQKHQGSDNTSPYPVSRLSAAMPLVDLAREISAADNMVNSRVTGQLQVIANQIRHLQDAARQILEKGQRDQALHHAQCNFKRQPGKTYYLYRKAGGQTYFSMLAPAEWGGRPPHEFIAAYRLEADMSWSSAEEIDTPDDSRRVLEKLLQP